MINLLKKHRHIIILGIVLAVLLSGCSNAERGESTSSKSESTPSASNVSNVPEEDLASNSDYTMHLQNRFSSEKCPGGDDWASNDGLYMESPSEPFTINFENGSASDTFALLLFYDYKQVAFSVDGTDAPNSVYKFSCDPNTSCTLKISLTESVDTEGIHELFASIVRNPDINYGMTFKNLYDDIGMNSLYYVCYDPKDWYQISAPENGAKLQMTERFSDRSVQSYCLKEVYASKLKGENTYGTPTSKITASPGQLLDFTCWMSPAVKNHDVLHATIGLKQTNINQKPYAVIPCKKNTTVEGDFNIQAPETPGTYDLILYCIDIPKKTLTKPDRSLAFEGITAMERASIIVE